MSNIADFSVPASSTIQRVAD